MITKIALLFILIGLNAFFAASEMALISLNDNKIKLMAENGNKKAKKLVKLLSEPSRFLATIQIGITLAGFLASAFAAESFADPIVGVLGGLNIPLSPSILKVSTVLIITLVLSYFTLVIGELVPKRIAMNRSESIAFFVVGPLTVLSIVANPFVKLLTFSTNSVVRLFGIDPNSTEDDVTEEEIRMLVDVGEEKGAINEREKIMINNIFEFNNKTAEDIMTHRMELVAIPKSIHIVELIQILKTEQYSRIPVYEKSVDNIVGILHVKDLLPLIASNSTVAFEIANYLRRPYYVPLQKRIDKLFNELQMAQTHIGIVIDEYGGTAGIVTTEDLVEEIMGNIFDEYDREEDREIRSIDEMTYEVNGTISLDELKKILDVDLPVEDFETLNGFLISLFGNIPPSGEVSEVNYNQINFKTIAVTEKRIEKVLVKVNFPSVTNHSEH